MKINKLILSAFGPYATYQEINFTELHEKRLFLVTGPTGAGKTSIFDAIAYALFGESSGNGRKSDDFISHFAGASDTTFVELDFDIKGKKCRIRREPRQEKLKTRGEGTTVKNAEASLVIDGELTTSVTEVNQKINELIGIDSTQFRQIVMLPQGDFRKLLEAGSSEREEIFRKIFKTDFFKMFQDQLKLRVKHLNQQIGEFKLKLENEISHIHCYGKEELKHLIQNDYLNYPEIISLTQELIEEMEDELSQIEMKSENVKKSIDSLTAKINYGKTINQKFDQYKQLELSQQQLNEKKSLIESYQAIIHKGSIADKIKQTEVQLSQVNDDYKRINHDIVNKQNEHNNLKNELQECLKQYDNLSKQYLELDEKKEKLFQSKNQLTKLLEYSSNLKQLDEHKKLVDLKEKQSTELNKSIDDISQNLKQLQEQIVIYDELKHKEHDINIKILTCEQTYKEGKRVVDQLDHIIKLYDEHHLATKDYESIKNKFKEKNNNYQNEYERYLQSQAGMLALTLKDNTPCPVCGSKEHPNKAHVEKEVKTLDELETFKLQVDELNDQKSKMYHQVLNLNQTIQEKQLDISSHSEKNLDSLEEIERHKQINENKLIELKEIKRKLISELNVCQSQLMEIEKVKETITTLKNQLEVLNDKQKDNQEQLNKTRNNYAITKSIIDKLKDDYQVDQLSYDELKQDINNQEQIIKQISDHFQKITDQKSKLNDQIIENESRVHMLQNHLENLKIKMDKLKQDFSNQVLKSTFKDVDEYHEFINQDYDYADLSKQIETYYQDLNYVNKTLNHLDQELKDEKVIDIDIFEQNKKELNDTLIQYGNLEKELYTMFTTNRKALNQINISYKLYNVKIDEYSKLSTIEKVTNGDNRLKMTFERYVLAAYFDDIIYAANLRLKDMTVNRYYLLRNDEKAKGNAGQGLDLLVLDSYTGMKRHVKTLSGGEAFIASLALALGLADVVSSYAGGIQLDTIFIDEGFGTLDPDALEHAIVTLNNIKESGRLVGIISHVQELKERIEAQLEIIPTKEGSIAKIRV